MVGLRLDPQLDRRPLNFTCYSNRHTKDMRFRIAILAVLLCCGFSALFAFQATFKEYTGEEENPAPVPKDALRTDRVDVRAPALSFGPLCRIQQRERQLAHRFPQGRPPVSARACGA